MTKLTVTSALGHLTTVDFPEQYKVWKTSNLLDLFEAPIAVSVTKVLTVPYVGLVLFWSCDRALPWPLWS